VETEFHHRQGSDSQARLWELIALDEAHIGCNLDAQVTQAIIRMQARYRYALTATPIPNVITNLFSLMGWLCVPDWYKGDKRNAAWPYAREEINRFDSTFRSVERDYTQEANQAAASKGRGNRCGKCTKVSPVISSPARLLKLARLAVVARPGTPMPAPRRLATLLPGGKVEFHPELTAAP